MIIQPKVKGFICTTAHPAGCKKNVEMQKEYVEKLGKLDGPKKVLVIGGSTGFGLASRITAAFAFDAVTINVSYEKLPTDKKTGTAGYYNTKAFDEIAKSAGLLSKSFNGDAFSNQTKEEVITYIRENLGEIDMLIYSVASPRRIDPITGETYYSVLKPLKTSYTNTTIDFMTGEMSKITLEPATPEEVEGTVKVMGGEDWELWIDALIKEKLLAEGAITIAYSYIGPELTFPIYRDGSIGKAKEHLEAKALEMNEKYKNNKLKAYVSVNKALVTQASSAIPVVPLYISVLYKIMKAKGIHEGCIEQIYRMFSDKILRENIIVDEKNRIRVDDWEMREDVQKEVIEAWGKMNQDNLEEILDLDGYRDEFYKLFGFNVQQVNYEEDIDIS